MRRQATDGVRIRIPEGVIAVKPMPKAGWTIEKTVTRYKEEYELHGEKVIEGVAELSWAEEAWRMTNMTSSFQGDARH